MQKAINRGFTLIELLVVIAIIGILASIVLVSLGSARSKGADAGIQGNLDSIRTQAEIYYGNQTPNTYGVQAGAHAVAGAACGSAGMWGDSTISQATKSASSQGGTATLNAVANQSVVCGSSASSWFVAVPMKTDVTSAWCVDSKGKAQKSTLANLDTAAEVTAAIGSGCPN